MLQKYIKSNDIQRNCQRIIEVTTLLWEPILPRHKKAIPTIPRSCLARSKQVRSALALFS